MPLVTVAQTPSGFGVGQGVLVLYTSSYAGIPEHETVNKFFQLLGLPVEAVQTDNTTITNSTFYDENGNAKHCLVVFWSVARNYINSTEKGYLDDYLKAWNVAEAGMFAYGMINEPWKSRFGISSIGNTIKVACMHACMQFSRHHDISVSYGRSMGYQCHFCPISL